jgi:glycine dehydrogenase subunit 2
MCGFHTVSIPSDANGDIDLVKLQAELDDTVVGLMLTNPNTLGLFEQQLREVTHAVHRVGGLVYGDGANLNAILGVVKPADMGSASHINVHKTFSTTAGRPAGRGGERAVEPFRSRGRRSVLTAFALDYDRPKSIGRLKASRATSAFWRAATVHSDARCRGLRTLSETAVLNANYLKALLSGPSTLPTIAEAGSPPEVRVGGARSISPSGCSISASSTDDLFPLSSRKRS